MNGQWKSNEFRTCIDRFECETGLIFLFAYWLLILCQENFNIVSGWNVWKTLKETGVNHSVQKST